MTNPGVREVQKHLRSIGDARIAENSKRFFKTGKGESGQGDRFLGHARDLEITIMKEKPIAAGRSSFDLVDAKRLFMELNRLSERIPRSLLRG
jgi:hypothetical protein